MINGVTIHKHKTHIDERGFFREIFRFNENFKKIEIGQLSHSLVNQGVIKSWHGHKYQYQWNYVISGYIKVALFDNRKRSSTYRKILEIDVENSIENATSYFFPPGVMHGYECIKGPINIIYVTSGTYDLDDEIRKTKTDLNLDYHF